MRTILAIGNRQPENSKIIGILELIRVLVLHTFFLPDLQIS